MLAWLVAVGVGAALALLGYAGRVAGRRAPLAIAAAACRGIAATLVVALLLDTPIGSARPPRPLVALDASLSWDRGGDRARFDDAATGATRQADDSLLVIGDSLRVVRPSARPALPADLASRVAPAVDRAIASGRPLSLHTDGVLEDPSVLRRLPVGSEARVPPARPLVDAAPVSLEAPRAAVGGDTVEVVVRVAAGNAPVTGGTVRATLDSTQLDSAELQPIAEWGEQVVRMRLPLPTRDGVALLGVVVQAEGDQEPRNDTVAVALELSTVAGVTVVSTAPDFDLRYMLEVLRGTSSLPTRAFLQVAPGSWRREGTLAPVSAEVVRDAARRAPILVLHGDTTVFGPTGAIGAGARLLMASPTGDGENGAQWYAVAAPPSPIAAVLAGVAWDSLPPVSTGGAEPHGEWSALTVQRGRRFERRGAIAGSESPRRVVVGVSGLWRWRFRGGVAAEAYTAVWGSIFDWLASERLDTRAALPDAQLLRAGEQVEWRRGGADSVVNVVLRRRGAADSIPLVLRFAEGAATSRSPALAAGVYDLEVAGGRSLLVVNTTRELLPVRPSVSSGPVGTVSPGTGELPRARSATWPFVLIVLLLCAEWLLRRRVGLR